MKAPAWSLTERSIVLQPCRQGYGTCSCLHSSPPLWGGAWISARGVLKWCLEFRGIFHKLPPENSVLPDWISRFLANKMLSFTCSCSSYRAMLETGKHPCAFVLHMPASAETGFRDFQSQGLNVAFQAALSKNSKCQELQVSYSSQTQLASFLCNTQIYLTPCPEFSIANIPCPRDYEWQCCTMTAWASMAAGSQWTLAWDFGPCFSCCVYETIQSTAQHSN